MGLSMGFPKCWWWINLCFFMFATQLAIFLCTDFRPKMLFCPPRPRFLALAKGNSGISSSRKTSNRMMGDLNLAEPTETSCGTWLVFWGKSTGNMALININKGETPLHKFSHHPIKRERWEVQLNFSCIWCESGPRICYLTSQNGGFANCGAANNNCIDTKHRAYIYNIYIYNICMYLSVYWFI